MAPGCSQNGSSSNDGPLETEKWKWSLPKEDVKSADMQTFSGHDIPTKVCHLCRVWKRILIFWASQAETWQGNSILTNISWDSNKMLVVDVIAAEGWWWQGRGWERPCLVKGQGKLIERDFPLATGYRIHSSLICNKHFVFMGSWDDKVIQY